MKHTAILKDSLFGIKFPDKEPNMFFTTIHDALDYYDYMDDPELLIVEYQGELEYKEGVVTYPVE